MPRLGQPRRGESAQRSQGPQEMYPLPQDTRTLVESLADQCLNYGLRVDRLLRCDVQTWDLTPQSKERFAKRVGGRKILEFKEPDDLARLIRAQKARWDAMLRDYEGQGYTVERLPMRAVSRVIVGLGAESVLETSIRLHRIYGFPIIPGSALKGLARSYALWKLAEQLGVPASSICKLEEYLDEPNEKRRDQKLGELKGDSAIPASAPLQQLGANDIEEMVKPMRDVYGTVGSAGQVIFFDAVPADPDSLKLDLDVMNPHYSDYYRGGSTPPADYLNPVPVFFLAIAPRSRFLFAVASRKSELAKQACEWLQKGLQELGVGAKTVAGYGLWEPEERQHPTASHPAGQKHASEAPQTVPEKPGAPHVWERTPKPGERFPAQVVDNSRKPIRVRLLVKGYEEEIVECGGVGNPEGFPPGTYVMVEISQYDQRTKRIKTVRLTGLWRA